MKTLLLAPELFTADGGIARILRLYLKALCEMAGPDDTVDLIALNDRVMDSADLAKYSNARMGGWRVCSRDKVAFVKAAIRAGLSSDRIICGHVAQLPVAWAVSKLRPKLEYYLVAHGIEVWRPFSLLERLSIRGCSRVLCVSDYTRRQLLLHCPMEEGRTAVVPNALDPYLDSKDPVPPPDGPPVVLCISRLSIADSYKGIEHLIRAMPAVSAEIPGVRLRIVGRGDALPRLQALATGLSMGRVVEFVGFRTDAELQADLEACRLFALTSEKEGFGLVYLEAMAHGRPCLGARAGGVPEVISEDSGVLVEYGDVPGIAAAMTAALRKEWPIGPILERVRMFSYLRFKERLASLI